MGEPLRVSPDTPVHEVVALMQERRNGCVTVQESGTLKGVFTERDILKRVLVGGVGQDRPVEAVMTKRVDVLARSDSVANVIRKMHAGGYRHMPVVDDGRVIGIISVREVVQFLVEHFPQSVYNLPPDPSAVAAAREGS